MVIIVKNKRINYITTKTTKHKLTREDGFSGGHTHVIVALGC